MQGDDAYGRSSGAGRDAAYETLDGIICDWGKLSANLDRSHVRLAGQALRTNVAVRDRSGAASKSGRSALRDLDRWWQRILVPKQGLAAMTFARGDGQKQALFTPLLGRSTFGQGAIRR